MGCVHRKRIQKNNTILLQKTTGKASPIRLQSSSTLDDYITISLLGTGKTCEVLKSYYRPLEEFRALKIIKKYYSSNYYLNELLMVQRLNHPNILKLYEMLEDSSNYYISSYYCEGGNLAKRIKRNESFTESDVAKIIFQVFSGLAHCHEHNVMHRDLKLENILLEKPDDLNIKIADFGLACLIDDKDNGGVCGTPSYMAPEIFSDSYTEKVDMWSAGVVLFVLTKNKFPLKCKKTEKKCRPDFSTFSLNVETCVEKNQDLEDLLAGLLEIDPNKRLSAREALNSAWIQSFINDI